MRAAIGMEVIQTYQPTGGGTRALMIEIAEPASFTTPTRIQQILEHRVEYSAPPTQDTVRTDAHGNRVRVVTWDPLPGEVQVRIRYRVSAELRLTTLESRAPYPVAGLSGEPSRYLAATPLVQRDDPEIQALARRLVAGARSQQEAVTNLLNFVVDHLRYAIDPDQYDARFSLDRRIGNCQNYSHLSLALLRAAGIPARIVGGWSLAKAWQVATGQGTLTSKNGQGRHAWIEVYYPDLGWVPYDAQISHAFVDTRYIRELVG
ncbi:MAG: transglutaminase family protein, partial [Deltaproteobacteria bacterium]|nr:transglutaminase family protein [Deltaproteobacteria bacterium]